MLDRLPSFASLETPIGRLWLSGTDAGLLLITRSDGPEPHLAELAARRYGPITDQASLGEPLGQLDAYFRGVLRTFDVPLDLRRVATFDAAACRAAMEIPYGETASYGEVAAMAGSPRAARAVGRAMARCPLFPIVPCHRVIHADGSIRGWGPDLWVKRWLLDHERQADPAGWAPAP
jgi:methylated-DNA-[protein]-cysteine S-methyltransferase